MKARAPDMPDSLLKDVRETASDVRGLTLTYVVALLYVGIIIFGSTHEQLLRVSNVTLPLLSVELPLVGFYVFTPWLLFLLHLNLLIQHYLLSQQVFAFRRQLDGVASQAKRAQLVRNLGHLPFVHWLAGDHHGRGLRLLLAVVVETSLVYWPLLTLAALQIAFLPYHNEGLVWLQRTALLADAAATLWLWPKILHPEDDGASWWKTAVPTVAARVLQRWRPALSEGWGSVRIIAGAPVVFATFVAGTMVWSVVFATVPDSWYEQRLLAFLPAWVQPPCKGRPVLFPTCAVHESGPHRLSRNLVVREKVLSANRLDPNVENAINSDSIPDAAMLDKVLGIDLSERDLRYADFSRSSFPRADFRESRLAGAKFTDARLVGVKFSNPLSSVGLTCKSGAPKLVELEDVDFTRARLVDATLDAANLSGAVLRYASLHGASLRAAELFGSDLYHARLDGADLSCARLHGANLSGASVVGANFQEALLVGVRIEEPIDVEGAHFLYAVLHTGRVMFRSTAAADFRQAQLAGLEVGLLIKQFGDVWRRLHDDRGGRPRVAQHTEAAVDEKADLGQTCATAEAMSEWRRIRSLPVARTVFGNMCRGAGADFRVSGMDQPGDQACVRDFLSEHLKECNLDPYAASKHMADALACRDRWLARSVLKRADDLDPRDRWLLPAEGETPFPGLGELIRGKLTTDKESCAELSDELRRQRRRKQGL
jgi:uncharacterized protein YjbI with pentapeptide repeats